MMCFSCLDVLQKGSEKIYPSIESLKTEKRLTVYFGIDPTGPSLHLGHLIPLRKLVALQKMGHEIILLIGDFTAMIGDPTDKNATRKPLTKEEVLENCKNYKSQASRIISFEGENAAQIRFNSEWLSKMSFSDVIELASHFTVQQMLERDMFEKRISECKPVGLHEFLYPLMQGYDSVALNADMEIGGSDQTFNMLAGRTLVERILGKEKIVLTTKLLTDSSGKKMGKSENNMVRLDDSPQEIFAKIMSWSDDMIVPGFELCTDYDEEELAVVRKDIKKAPMAMKWDLAKTIVASLHTPKDAIEAAGHWSSIHQNHEEPEDMEERHVDNSLNLKEILVEIGFASSNTNAQQLIEQGGVKVNGIVEKDPYSKPSRSFVLQKGKRHFIKII